MTDFKGPKLPRGQKKGDTVIDTDNFNLGMQMAGFQHFFGPEFNVQNNGQNAYVTLKEQPPKSCRWFRASIGSGKDRECLIENGYAVTPSQHLEEVPETTVALPNAAGEHAIYLEHTPGGSPTSFVYANETWPLADPDPLDNGHKFRKIIAVCTIKDVQGSNMLTKVEPAWCGGFARFDSENHFASFWAELKSSPSGSGLQDWEKVRWDSLGNYSKDLDFPWDQTNAGGQCEHLLGAAEAYPTGTVVLMQRLLSASGTMKNVYTIPDLPGFWAEVTYSTGSGDWTFAEREPNAGETDMVALSPAGRSGTAMEVNDATADDATTVIAWIQPTLKAGGGVAYCFDYDDAPDPDPIVFPRNSFNATVTKSGSSWTFQELKQTSGGYSTLSVGDGGRSGPVRERNGLAPPASGSASFVVEVLEYENPDDQQLYYSFTLPIWELGSAYQLLRTDPTGNNWEWGCAEIT